MIILILPLLLDYLDIPFELVQANKVFNEHCHKYTLTFVTKKLIDKNVLKFHKFKNIALTGDSEITDEDIIDYQDNFKHLYRLCLPWNFKLSQRGLKYLPELKILSLYSCDFDSVEIFSNLTQLDLFASTKIQDSDMIHFQNIEILKLYENKIISDAGLKYLNKIKILGLPECFAITSKGLKCIVGCYFKNLHLPGYKYYEIVH